MERLLARAARVIREYDMQGDHRTGTAVDRASAEWLAERARDAGAEPILEPFALDRVEAIACFLEVAGRRIDGLPKFDSGFTDARGITGTLGPLDSDAEIALLAATANGEYSPAFTRALAVRRHRAFVVVTTGALPGLTPINAARFARPQDRPVLMVSSVEGDWLREQADRRPRARFVLQIERVPTTAYNVVVRITGTTPDLAPVVVMTPRSGWWNCASERGGGLVCWLEALRAITAAAPRRTVFFTANSGHELGHLGLDAFREQHPELQRGAHVWLHFGANIGAVGSPVVLQCATDALRDLAEGALARSGLRADEIIGPEQAPVGEARNIHESGEHYLSLLGRPGPVFHHPADRWPGWVDLGHVVSLAAAQQAIALRLAGTE